MPASRPWALSTEAPFGLRREGAPALLVDGQVFNSASSSPKAIADSFAHVRRVGAADGVLGEVRSVRAAFGAAFP